MLRVLTLIALLLLMLPWPEFSNGSFNDIGGRIRRNRQLSAIGLPVVDRSGAKSINGYFLKNTRYNHRSRRYIDFYFNGDHRGHDNDDDDDDNSEPEVPVVVSVNMPKKNRKSSHHRSKSHSETTEVQDDGNSMMEVPSIKYPIKTNREKLLRQLLRSIFTTTNRKYITVTETVNALGNYENPSLKQTDYYEEYQDQDYYNDEQLEYEEYKNSGSSWPEVQEGNSEKSSIKSPEGRHFGHNVTTDLSKPTIVYHNDESSTVDVQVHVPTATEPGYNLDDDVLHELELGGIEIVTQDLSKHPFIDALQSTNQSIIVTGDHECFTSVFYILGLSWLGYMFSDYKILLMSLMVLTLFFTNCAMIMCIVQQFKRQRVNLNEIDDVPNELGDLKTTINSLRGCRKKRLSFMMYRRLHGNSHLLERYFEGTQRKHAATMDFKLLMNDLQTSSLNLRRIKGNKEVDRKSNGADFQLEANNNKRNDSYEIDLTLDGLQQFLYASDPTVEQQFSHQDRWISTSDDENQDDDDSTTAPLIQIRSLDSGSHPGGVRSKHSIKFPNY